jgi:hypothetical protein
MTDTLSVTIGEYAPLLKLSMLQKVSIYDDGTVNVTIDEYIL